MRRVCCNQQLPLLAFPPNLFCPPRGINQMDWIRACGKDATPRGVKVTSALVDTMKQISATFFPALFLIVSSSAHPKASSCQFVSAGIFTR